MANTDLPPITLLLQEVQTVTSAMRRNQRWATATSLSSASSQPRPPYLRAASAARRHRASSGSSLSKKRGSQEGLDEGDLMDGFVELRRTLTDTQGQLRFGYDSQLTVQMSPPSSHSLLSSRSSRWSGRPSRPASSPRSPWPHCIPSSSTSFPSSSPLHLAR